VVVDSSLAQRSERELDGGSVWDRCGAGVGYSVYVSYAEPEVFKGGVGVPLYGEFVAVGFQITGLEGSVGGSEVRKHVKDGNIGKTENIVLEILEKDFIHGRQDLLLDLLAHLDKRVKVGEGSIVSPIGGRDECVGITSGVNGEWTRMRGFDKRLACTDGISACGHSNTKVTIESAPSC
jgi:hypothetical protein